VETKEEDKMIPFNKPIDKIIEELEQLQKYTLNNRVRELKRAVFEINMALYSDNKLEAIKHIMCGYQTIDNMLYSGRCSGKTYTWLKYEKMIRLHNLYNIVSATTDRKIVRL
jgi:hypothetical protein